MEKYFILRVDNCHYKNWVNVVELRSDICRELIEIVVDYLWKDLIEYVGALTHLQIKEFKNKYEFFTHSLYNQFVLWSKYLFGCKFLMFLFTYSANLWWQFITLEYVESIIYYERRYFRNLMLNNSWLLGIKCVNKVNCSLKRFLSLLNNVMNND